MDKGCSYVCNVSKCCLHGPKREKLYQIVVAGWLKDNRLFTFISMLRRGEQFTENSSQAAHRKSHILHNYTNTVQSTC